MSALGVDQASLSRWESGARGIPPLLDRALRDLEQSRYSPRSSARAE